MKKQLFITDTNRFKGILPIILLTFLPLLSSAQVKFGYLSYDEALRAMPQYSIAQRNLSDLKAQYAAEAKRAENEFNAKYEAFMEEQAKLATAIRRKRQAELQTFMERNIAFKHEAKQLLEAAEKDALTPLREKLTLMLQQIGQERGYAFILNTDAHAVPYVDNSMGEDIGPLVAERLKE